MVPRLPLALVIALGSATLVSCLAGSDDDDGSTNNAGTGGSSAGTGGSTSGGSGGSAGSGTGGTGGSSGSGTGGNATGGLGTGGTGTGGGDTGGTGGSDTGGTGSGGSDTGGSGGSDAGTGGMACCLAIPVCGENETEVAGPEDCPPSATCRELTLCCSTIWCASSGGSAGAGGTAGAGGSGGKPGACDPDNEPDRNYVGNSPEQCAVILYSCPEHTEAFGNDCGCGCEQDESCPDFIDCMPGTDPNPGCTPEERARCPYSEIAF